MNPSRAYVRKPVGSANVGSKSTESTLHESSSGLDKLVARTSNTQPSSTLSTKGVLAILIWWLPELFAALLSFTALASIVAVAQHYRGWGVQDVGLPSGLTLNGLIALLSTIARVALMVPVASVLSQEVWLWLSEAQAIPTSHRAQLQDLEYSDAASRGAVGSLLILRHVRRSWLVHCAAIVTITSLLFGTFTQQLITLRPFPAHEADLQPGNAPRSETYANITGRASRGDASVPLNLKAAAYNGILTSNVQPVPASCPTGNCSFPITPSLAICGGCQRSTFKKSCTVADAMDDPAEGLDYTIPVCRYRMPSGALANLTDFAYSQSGRALHVFNSRGSAYDMRQSHKQFLANFEVVGAPFDVYDYGPWQNDSATTVAAECALWICVQSFEIQIINGILSQNVREEHDVVDASEQARGGGVVKTTFIDMPSTMNIPKDADYNLFGLSRLGLENFLSSLFYGNVTIDLGTQVTRLASDDMILALWNASADLDAWIKNVASSMTNVIRSETPAHLARYDGTAYQLGYEVRWPWIALPAVLVAASLSILVVIIYKTSKSLVHPWKGSPFALLFMTVNQALRDQSQGKLNENNGIQNAMGKTEVELIPDESGSWALQSQ